ncbi:MAG: hypothetical protein ACTSY1_02460 [Alphaproteobacteria bacterium]
MTQIDDETKMARLKQVVGAYGAQPSRWPSRDRRALAALAKAQAQTSWMRRAVELDQMLDQGADFGPDIVPTKAILAAVGSTAQSPAATVVAIESARFRLSVSQEYWPWAAVLAASLLIGIWAGANGAVDYLLPDTVGDALMAVNGSEDESNFFGLFDQGPASASEGVI